MAVGVSTSETVTFGRPQHLFVTPVGVVGSMVGGSVAGGNMLHPFDVFPDAQRFLMIDRDTDAAQDTVHIVENWDEPFRDRAQ